ncbi:ATP-binding protein [Candidatus Synechococcus calcipolaris G9]|uniref:ATP-binding protein n=1 Tax=Candidatus Synechococcus calcipolaris G9 TaxID=1497997 RepID=A0ABT6F032_9SYNE|nr:ATP-binding protein [Candidatus Synechococcus calcipolaris]MDG2991197.1 ATP-binding protein [Candidatus Synechococcus calcipolaris G9]
MAHHLLIGPPASGKSTFADYLCLNLPDAVIVATDDIRRLLYGDPRHQGAWPQIEAEVLGQIQRSLQRGFTIIYDATNVQHRYRVQFLRQVRILTPEPWIGWQLLTDLETCKQWNHARDRQVPETVIEQMYQDLTQTPPSLEEGFRRLYHVTLTPRIAIQEFQGT